MLKVVNIKESNEIQRILNVSWYLLWNENFAYFSRRQSIGFPCVHQNTNKFFYFSKEIWAQIYFEYLFFCFLFQIPTFCEKNAFWMIIIYTHAQVKIYTCFIMSFTRC